MGPANRPAFCRQVPLFYAKCPSKTFSRLAGLRAGISLAVPSDSSSDYCIGTTSRCNHSNSLSLLLAIGPTHRQIKPDMESTVLRFRANVTAFCDCSLRRWQAYRCVFVNMRDLFSRHTFCTINSGCLTLTRNRICHFNGHWPFCEIRRESR